VRLGKDVNRIEYLEQHGLYAFAINSPEEFLLVDEEGQPKEVPEGNNRSLTANIDPLEFIPEITTSSLELIHPVTFKTVDTCLPLISP
jgi:hypothetical protein